MPVCVLDCVLEPVCVSLCVWTFEIVLLTDSSCVKRCPMGVPQPTGAGTAAALAAAAAATVAGKAVAAAAAALIAIV